MYFETGDKIIEVNVKLTEQINILRHNVNNRITEENKVLRNDLDYAINENTKLKNKINSIEEYIKLPWYKKIFKKYSYEND